MTVFVDVETTGLDPRRDSLRLVSVNGELYDTWDTLESQKGLERLRASENEMLVAHNAQFDLDFLEEHLGYEHKGPVFDTMIAWQLIENGRKGEDGKNIPARLDYVAEKLLGVKLDKTLQKAGWDGFVFDDARAYASEDTKVLEPLYEKLVKGLHSARQYDIFKLEMALLPVLLKSKRKGIFVDVDAANRLLGELDGEITTLTKELPDKLNPRSPQQVADYFNLPNSEEDTLRDASNQTNNPLLRKVMAIRKLLKKQSSIKKQILGHVAYDGRIHSNYKQTFAETGRLSSSDPNLQNQDRGPDVRGLFKAIDGHKLVIADYSQLEVRIAALLCGDETLLSVLRDNDRDMHSETCARIFGEENKKTRTLSKNILFGSLFGGGPGTVVRFAAKSDVVISESDAREFQSQLFSLYPGLKGWHHKAGNTNPEYVYSLLGRRRYIPKGVGYCTRINHPVQSSAADGQKLAMVLMAKQGLTPVTNVHDELLFEVEESKAGEAVCKVEEIMVNAMYRATKQDPTNPVVPIKVEAGIADDWSEK